MRTLLHPGPQSVSFARDSVFAARLNKERYSVARRAPWRHLMEHEIEASPAYTLVAIKAEHDLCACHFIRPLSATVRDETETLEQWSRARSRVLQRHQYPQGGGSAIV